MQSHIFKTRMSNYALISIPGLALSLLLAACLIGITATARAQVETVLYSFTGGTDGGMATGKVFLDANGNIIGTTERGGILGTGLSGEGSGVVYKVSLPSGNETVLYTFTGGADGYNPDAGVIQDQQGNYYSTVQLGGQGYGAVYEIDKSGNFMVLHAFTGGADGNGPASPLAIDSLGNLYGATSGGGSGYGVVFKLSPPAGGTGAWTETVLHAFTGSDGGELTAGVVLDNQVAGDIYGTTLRGGTSNEGVVFKLDSSGNETVVHSFTGGSDGAFPAGDLIQDTHGNLYGTASNDGASGAGVVFKIDTQGNFSTLYAFTGGADGGYPVDYGGMAVDQQGNQVNLYGTTARGGADGYGVVFELSSPANGGMTWNETVLHTFTNFADGGSANSGLVLDSNGNLFGATDFGGTHNEGVVFELNPSAPLPTVKAVSITPSSVKSGQSAIGLVVLTGPAQAGGQTVTLGSSNPAVASVPDFVIVQGGQTSATFPVTTFSVKKTAKVTIYATFNGTTKTAKLKVKK